MGDLDIHSVRERIETVEKRIAAMQEAGVDASPLRAQLAFAHTALREVRLNDADAICEDVLAAAKRLAEIGQVSTEAIRRVRVSRAQLAEEVRAAIVHEVQQQSPGAVAVDPQLIARLEALDRRLAELEARPQPAVPPPVDIDAVVRTVLAAVPQPPAPTPMPDIDLVVRTAVAEAVPAQASELLREAISKLPTRDDLTQIADTLRADLDWRLERAAAEHGWCSLADVQTTVRKAIAEQEPGGSTAAPVSMARLEAALTEFVQQTREQQERLIQALADRVAAHTAGLTKKLIVRDAQPASPRHETEELKPSSDGSSSDFLAAVPANPVTIDDHHLDAVTPEAVAEAKKAHGSTTLYTKAITSKPSETEDLHELVSREVEKALTEPAIDSTMHQPQTLPPDEATSQTATAAPSVEPEPLPPTATIPASTPPTAAIEPLVAAEVARQLAHTLPVQLPPADGDLARALVRVLPQVLADDAVRTELFAVLSLEAATKPGALGELTGLRRYLKRELAQVAEELHAGQTA